MRVLLLDNFDSFTHNLAQGLAALGAEVVVRRNDALVDDLLALRPGCVVLSPGPGTPARTGSAAALLAALPATTPVLGVCLGMQLMAQIEGAAVVPAPEPVHGRASPLRHDGLGIFDGLPQGIPVGRYHSLCVDAATLPPRLVPTAWCGGVLMGLRDAELPREGIQFHPESVLTPHGPAMLANFLRHSGMRGAGRGRPR